MKSTAYPPISRYFALPALIAISLLIGCGGGKATSTGAAPLGRSVELSWVPSVSSVRGYNIYRGTMPGGPYPSKRNSSPLPGTRFVDEPVLPGTYYYVATSLDETFVESRYSEEVKAVVP
jgi:hypothetical protein